MSAAKKAAEITEIKQGPLTTVPAEGADIMSMIQIAMSRPDFPVATIERMFDLYQRSEAEKARKAYYAALALMQPKLPIIEKKGTIKTNEKDQSGKKTGQQKDMAKYALWEDIVEGITPILAEHGFSLFFINEQPTPDRIVTICNLAHREGHKETSSVALPIDSTGAKNNVQGWGSSISYGKRYSAGALLNLTARGEDDDGTAAGIENDATLSDEQIATLRKLLEETKTKEAAFLHHITKTETLEEVRAATFETLANFLEAKKTKQKAEREAPV